MSVDPLARLAELERENQKLRRINAALIERVESSGPGRDASYAAFQHSVELAEQVRERTDALNQAMAELKASNRLLSDARLRAETAHQHLIDAIESISDAFVLFDRDQRIVLFNRRFKSLWSRTRARINAGTRLAEVRRLAESTGLIVEEHRGKGDEPTVYRLNNGRWVQVSERRTQEGGLVVLYTDITEVKVSETMRREQALAQKSRLLQRASTACRRAWRWSAPRVRWSCGTTAFSSFAAWRRSKRIDRSTRSWSTAN